MAKGKKEELVEGVDAPSIDPVVTEDASDVVAVETVDKSLLDEALAKIEKLEADKIISDKANEDLEKQLEQALIKIEKLEVGPVDKKVKKVVPVSFEFEGEKYQFSENAPQSILLNGKGLSQKEIASDEELKLQLIGGNSSLIIKK